MAYLPLVDTVTSELSSTRPYSGKRTPLVLGFRILADSADHLPDLADLLPPVDLPATADLDRWSDGKRSLAASEHTRAKHPTQPWSSWPSGSTLRASATRNRSWLALGHGAFRSHRIPSGARLMDEGVALQQEVSGNDPFEAASCLGTRRYTYPLSLGRLLGVCCCPRNCEYGSPPEGDPPLTLSRHQASQRARDPSGAGPTTFSSTTSTAIPAAANAPTSSGTTS